MKQYLDFLNLASTLLIPFDDTAKRLLEEVALCTNEGKELTVMQAMDLVHIASPATVHRKMTDLLVMGYIVLEHKGDNRRTKYLKLTQQAVRYFEKMESFMVKP